MDFRAVLIPVISRADAHELAKLQTACRMWREAAIDKTAAEACGCGMLWSCSAELLSEV